MPWYHGRRTQFPSAQVRPTASTIISASGRVFPALSVEGAFKDLSKSERSSVTSPFLVQGADSLQVAALTVFGAVKTIRSKLRPLLPPASQNAVGPPSSPGGGAATSVLTAAAGERCQMDDGRSVTKSRRRVDK